MLRERFPKAPSRGRIGGRSATPCCCGRNFPGRNSVSTRPPCWSIRAISSCSTREPTTTSRSRSAAPAAPTAWNGNGSARSPCCRRAAGRVEFLRVRPSRCVCRCRRARVLVLSGQPRQRPHLAIVVHPARLARRAASGEAVIRLLPVPAADGPVALANDCRRRLQPSPALAGRVQSTGRGARSPAQHATRP